MALSFPRIIMLIPKGDDQTVAVTGAGVYDVPDAVYLDIEQSYFNPMGKIEVEAAHVDTRYVHLRFTHTNKYWSQRNAEDRFIVAVSKEPEEDVTKISCTMFEPVTSAAGDGTFQLIHAQSGGRVVVDLATRFVVTSNSSPPDPTSLYADTFGFVDWETIVKVPQNVAFKGYNGKYVQAFFRDGKPFLQFSSDDPNEQASGFQVMQPQQGGRYYVIKSNGTGKLWRADPAGNWILADMNPDADNTTNTAVKFQAFKLDDPNIIALKNISTNSFCRIFTGPGGVTNCLSASSPNIIRDARLEVRELVSKRSITNVRYRIEDARVFNQAPFLAGEFTLYNKSDKEVPLEGTVKYEDEKSYTFSRGFSSTVGVTTTVETGLPFIAKGEISFSLSLTGELKWESTKIEKFKVTAKGSVPVPPRSKALIKYVGTKGSCTIPYSYTQEDTLSFNGNIVTTPQNDGIYKCENCYNFGFVVDKVTPL